jgi:hypothetical protein
MLEKGRLSWITYLGPNVITSVFIKAEEDLMTTKKAI